MATNSELTNRYNELATQLGKPTIAPWKNKKEIIEARIVELEAQLKPVKKPVKADKPKKADKPTAVEKAEKSIPELVKAFTTLLAAETPPSEAVRKVMEQHPKATRIQIKHSAIAAGINGLTARNTFDRVRRAA